MDLAIFGQAIAMKNKLLSISFLLIFLCVLSNCLMFISLVNCLFMIILILFITLLIIIYLKNKEMDHFSGYIIDILDDAYNENIITYSNNEETIESKIQFKLNRLLDKIQNEIDFSRKNQNKLQSLITDLSHQVKTPLTNIKLYSDILKKNQFDEKNVNFYKKMDEQIDKVEFLMGSIIKISRLENNIITIEPKCNNIKETLIKSISDVFYKADKKSINIEYKPQDYFAMYDEKWTVEAISNVLDNAIKYSSDNEKITIMTNITEFYCIIKIQDNGIGINKKEYNNIFKRFYREIDKHKYDGIGIGLYLTREILSLEHGYISVESEINVGSCFSIYLSITE